MTKHHYVRATKLIGLDKIAAKQERDLSSAMREVGLDPNLLKKPEEIIDYTAFCNLLRNCAVNWNVPDIGLQMVQHQKIDVLGPVALVTRMEGTVRGAVKAIIANLVIHSDVTIAALEETGDVAILILNQQASAPQISENSELVLAQGKMVLDTIMQTTIPLEMVSFMHSKGESASAVSRFFQCPIIYNEERNALTFRRSILDYEIERTDQAYHALIQRYLDTARDEMGEDLVEKTKTEIARQMELGHCTLESIAASQRLSPHTLQRRLRSKGQSFRQLQEDWRRTRARALVTNTRLPLSEVSKALGYSDQSVFTQAFRRWYGKPPHQYRTAI